MSKLSIFKDLADFFSFRTRRLILYALVVSSVVPGTLFWLLPAIWRNYFFWDYLFLITLGITSQRRFLIRFTKTAFFSVIFSRKYKPVQYSTPEVDALARTMGVSGRVKVNITANPFIEGPYTLAIGPKCLVYIPANWIETFPKSEIIAVLAHEFSHVRRQMRFALEVGAAVVVGYAFATGLQMFAELLLHTALLILVWLTGYLTVAFLATCFVSWRNEYRADLDGAKVTGPEGLISVFETVKKEWGKDEGSETHPPLSKRIDRLMKLLDLPPCASRKGSAVN